jgi:hypothetical protein
LAGVGKECQGCSLENIEIEINWSDISSSIVLFNVAWKLSYQDYASVEKREDRSKADISKSTHILYQ